MNGFIALGYMLIEEGRIVSVRHKEKGFQVDHDKVKYGAIRTVPDVDLQGDGWELGWSCPKCMGDGIITFPCPRCSGRSLHSLLENPCCGGWDEAECPECEGGIQWKDEY